MDDGEREEITSYLKLLFADCEIMPRNLQQGLLNVYGMTSNAGGEETYLDCFIELTDVFHFTVFEDRRDLGFSLLASRKFKDDIDELVKLCPTPVLYRLPFMEDQLLDTLQDAFIRSDILPKERLKLLDTVFLYFCLKPSQIAQIAAWISCEAIHKAHITLPEYKALLKLLTTCVGSNERILLSGAQRESLIKALKPSMYVYDFRFLFNRNEYNPYRTYVFPTICMLEKLVEVFDLHDEDIIENHYFYWNAAIVSYLTREFPRLVREAEGKRPYKRKGKKTFSIYPSTGEKFIKDISRLPFERLQKDLILVGNACMHQLQGHSLYGRCSYLHLPSV